MANDDVLGGGYLYNSKPFNVINPSGVSGGESLGVLTQNRQINTQANIAAANRRTSQLQHDQELSLEKQKLETEDRRYEDEVSYRRRMEALAVQEQNLRFDLDDVQKRYEAAVASNQADEAAQLARIMDTSSQRLSQIQTQRNKVSTFKIAMENLFHGNVKDPTGSSVPARLYRDLETHSIGEWNRIEASRQGVLDAFNQTIAAMATPPAQPNQGSNFLFMGFPSSSQTPDTYWSQSPPGQAPMVGVPPSGPPPIASRWMPLASSLVAASAMGGDAKGAEGQLASLFDNLEKLSTADPRTREAIQKSAVATWDSLTKSGAVDPKMLGHYLYMLQKVSGAGAIEHQTMANQQLVQSGKFKTGDVGAMGGGPSGSFSSMMTALRNLSRPDETGKSKYFMTDVMRDSDVFDLVKGSRKEPMTKMIDEVVSYLGGIDDPDQLLEVLSLPADERGKIPNQRLFGFLMNLDDELRTSMISSLRSARNEVEQAASRVGFDPSLPKTFPLLDSKKDEAMRQESVDKEKLRAKHLSTGKEIVSKGTKERREAVSRYKQKSQEARSGRFPLDKEEN